MFLSTAFSLRHASWKDKCDVHRNISYGFQLLTLITTGQSCGDRSHRALLLMTHQVLCYTEVSPIRKFVSNDRKFRPLERSILYSFDPFNGRNGRNFRSFETNFLIGETSGVAFRSKIPTISPLTTSSPSMSYSLLADLALISLTVPAQMPAHAHAL